MADDKLKRGAPDRRRASQGEQYEVRYFARKHELAMADARAITGRRQPRQGQRAGDLPKPLSLPAGAFTSRAAQRYTASRLTGSGSA